MIFDLQRFAIYKVIPNASTPSGAAAQDPVSHFAVSDKTVTVYNRDFEGTTDAANGKNGMVPAPTVNDKDKFLKGNGTWSGELILPTISSSVDGGFWLDVSGTPPVPKFYYGGTTYVFDVSLPSAEFTITPSTVTIA